MFQHEYDALKMRVQQGLMSFEAAMDHMFERLTELRQGVAVEVPAHIQAVVEGAEAAANQTKAALEGTAAAAAAAVQGSSLPPNSDLSNATSNIPPVPPLPSAPAA